MADEVPGAPTFASPAESTLVYCFADRWIRTPGRLDSGHKIPLAGVSVARNVLVNTLVGVAFGSLASRGKLSFGEVEHKTLFVKTRHVVVSFAPPVRSDEESPSSLEFDILKFGSQLKDPTVKNVVASMYGVDVPDPAARVVMFVGGVPGVACEGALGRQDPHGDLGRHRLTQEIGQRRRLTQAHRAVCFAGVRALSSILLRGG